MLLTGYHQDWSLSFHRRRRLASGLERTESSRLMFLRRQEVKGGEVQHSYHRFLSSSRAAIVSRADAERSGFTALATACEGSLKGRRAERFEARY